MARRVKGVRRGTYGATAISPSNVDPARTIEACVYVGQRTGGPGLPPGGLPAEAHRCRAATRLAVPATYIARGSRFTNRCGGRALTAIRAGRVRRRAMKIGGPKAGGYSHRRA